MTFEQNTTMADFEVKECLSVIGTPDVDGEAPCYRVGGVFWLFGARNKSECPTVERITLQRDVHGEMCMKARACVWVAGKIRAEIPYQALTFIEYLP